MILAWAILVTFLPTRYTCPLFALDHVEYCNAVQNKVGFIRYPLGTIGAWSTGSGETADVIKRTPRIYPCVTGPVLKSDKEDWRASITGDPSCLSIRYRPDKPSGASAVAITVAPHVSVFKVTFPEDAKDRSMVLDFRKAPVDTWARLYKWTDRTVTRVDDRTLAASIGEPGKKGAFYVVRFSTSCVASGQVTDPAAPASGAPLCWYARFDVPAVTVAVAVSFSSPKQAEEFLAAEFADFDTVHARCHSAWNETLSRVEVEAPEESKRMAYTALYTMVANTIDGSWGPIENAKMTWDPNPQGLFEGTTKDWMFAVPHDPYGLIHLPGQEGFVPRVVDYCLNDAWFNDYQEIYPYMLYYAGAANEAQSILRNTWVPLFSQGVMYEGVRPKPPHNGWQTYYVGASGWLLCSMLGLYPGSAPAGQFLISSPSVTKVVIHNGKKDITIETKNNDGENIYVRSIRVDGRVYPAYMIPAQRLVAGVRIELEMSSDRTAGLGNLYLSSSDGFVRSAELVSASHLKCTIEAAVTDAATKIYSRTKPVQILVNGRPDSTWGYDEANKTVSIQSAGTATIEVVLM